MVRNKKENGIWVVLGGGQQEVKIVLRSTFSLQFSAELYEYALYCTLCVTGYYAFKRDASATRE